MSISESQYYEAKVFLKALIDAHHTLEQLPSKHSQATKQQAKVDKLKYYEASLISSIKRGQVKVSGDTLIKGQGFQSTRVAYASDFVKAYINSRLKDFNSLNNFSQLTSALQNGAQ